MGKLKEHCNGFVRPPPVFHLNTLCQSLSTDNNPILSKIGVKTIKIITN